MTTVILTTRQTFQRVKSTLQFLGHDRIVVSAKPAAAQTKPTMQEELARIWREEKVAMILVTHDLEEAIYLADRVLVLPNEKGTVPRLIEVDLRRPRDRSDPQFVEMWKRLMTEFGLH